MGNRLFERIKSVKRRWWIFGVVVVLLALALLSRPKPEEKTDWEEVDYEITPTMFTRDAVSLVSDSGYTRYRIEAPVWYVYDEAKDPNWKFNEGLYLEKYDDSMEVIATFVCDSAIYRTVPKIWEFIGNVRMRNTSGDKFLTEQMYWNSADRKIYSDSFIHIEKSDRIIEGYGFVTNESMEEYTVNRPTMIIPVSDFNRQHQQEVDNDEGGAPAADANTAIPPTTGAKSPTPARASQRLTQPRPNESMPVNTPHKTVSEPSNANTTSQRSQRPERPPLRPPRNANH